MSAPKPVTMTDAEAEALYQAACYVLNHGLPAGGDLSDLQRAASKLRRASTLIIEQEE